MIRSLRVRHRMWAWLLLLLGGAALIAAIGSRAGPLPPGPVPAADPR